MCKLSTFDKFSAILVLLGSLTWGIIGIFNVNILFVLSGGSPSILRIIYILILICAIDLISLIFRCNIVRFNKDK
ncbi:DUF378 domain-containing protein [Clostridium sp. 1001271B_151109_B4]|uniref:DUF378 domain-containing protein n=1 Tax=Clostridium sp. 1001271B_151109_B4 TaxID=2787148 RepID=UPI0018A98DFC|nr:DUF378 domain-containing protein [Clostridium sp. 1001271B_151109_B4]